jgi:hypothetical protein
MAWAKVYETVGQIVSPPPELMLFCGMSIGFADPTSDSARFRRAPLDETATFLGG